MIRTVAVVFGVGLVVSACLSINPTAPSARPATTVATLPPLPLPSATPSLQPTTTPAPTLTLEPTVKPSSGPTEQATATPLAPSGEPSASAPTPGASPAGVVLYGAADPRFDDSFDDPGSGWGVGTNVGGSVAYGDSALEIKTAANHSSEWTSRLTGATDNAVYAETVWTPKGTGYYGLLCSDSDTELWGAVQNDAGQYAFVKIDSSGATILSSGQLDSLKLPTGEFGGTGRFALNCAGTAAPDRVFKMQLYAPGTNQGVQWFADPGEGPATFNRLGVYAESGDQPSSLSVDYVLGFGGDGNTAPSPESVELMTHIPSDWQPNCFESFASVYMTNVKADVLCQLFDGRSDYAEYMSFSTQQDMDASYDYMLNKYSVAESGLNCDSGAHQGTYTIGDVQSGRDFCAPSVTGTQFVWTYDPLLIMTQLIDLEGSYPDMHTDWLAAGPN